MDYECTPRLVMVAVFILADIATDALRVHVPRKTVALGGSSAVLRCRYHLSKGEKFQKLVWTGPYGTLFELPHTDYDGNIYTNGSFLDDYKRRGSSLPYYRGKAITELLISLSQTNYYDKGEYNCTVWTNSGLLTSDTTKLLLDYSTSRSTIQCHRKDPFHLWCSKGTIQIYALEYGWNHDRNACTFEPHTCTDDYRYPENRTHLQRFIGRCSGKTACYINPKPEKLKCYGFPVIISRTVAVRYWCTDPMSKSISVCHNEGTIPLWCQTGTVKVHELRYGMNSDPHKCTEYDDGSCVERYTLLANRSHVEQYSMQCDGRSTCYLNPNPVRLKDDCNGYHGIISSFVTIYYSCEVLPENPVVDKVPREQTRISTTVESQHTTSLVIPSTTTAEKIISQPLCTGLENNIILVAVIASSGLIVGVLLTLLGEFIFRRCCKKTPIKDIPVHQEPKVEDIETTRTKQLEEISIYRSDTYESLEMPECSTKQVVELSPSMTGLCGGESYVNTKL